MNKGLKKFVFWSALFAAFIVLNVLIFETFTIFFIAFIFAYLLSPLIDKIYTKYKIDRNVIVYAIFFTFFGFIILILATLSPILYNQIALLIKKIPIYNDYIQKQLMPLIIDQIQRIDPEVANRFIVVLQGFIDNALSIITAMMNNMWSYTMATINVFILMVLVPIILLYLLKEWNTIISHLENLIPIKQKNNVKKLLSSINQLLSAYIRGQLNVCIILAAFYGTGLSIIGVDLALLLGIISGFLIIIPFIGSIISFTLIIVLGYIDFGFSIHLLYIMSIYFSGSLIEGYILTPKIIGSSIGVHPLWILFSVFANHNLFGFVGVLFAIPIAGILKILLMHLIDYYKSTDLYCA